MKKQFFSKAASFLKLSLGIALVFCVSAIVSARPARANDCIAFMLSYGYTFELSKLYCSYNGDLCVQRYLLHGYSEEAAKAVCH